MTVELRPLGDKCNLRCSYCYENPLRDHTVPEKPNWLKIKQAIIDHGCAFTVFGGEPLLIPLKELEEIFAFGYEKYRTNGIQTNGSMITHRHIEMFEKYAVHIGFSIDGPGELNDARTTPSGSLSSTRRMTNKSVHNLNTILAHPNIVCSLIVTLSRHNASRDRLPALIKWLRELDKKGLKHARLHLLEPNGPADQILSRDEQLDALTELYHLEKTMRLKFDIFGDIEARLRTGTGGTCVYNGCDPYNTRAVQGIGPNGEPTNCGHTNREGIDFIKTTDQFPMRSHILRSTPQEDGGCQGCQYWYACQGNCPGGGENGDWRNRTSHCSLLKGLFSFMCREKDIPVMKEELWPNADGNRDHVDAHGDSHADSDHLNSYHANAPHGDVPHTDIVRLPKLEVR